MWRMVLVTLLAILVASTPLWAQSLATVSAGASVLVLVDVVGDSVRGSPEPLKLAFLGGGLIVASVRLRRRRGMEAAED